MAADSAEGHEAWGEAVVIDLGSAFCRAGLVQSGSDEPMARFESIVGTPKTPPIMVGMPQPVYVGERALGRCGVLILQKPVVRGLVADWQAAERVWHHIYFNELRVVPEEHPVLLTEAPLTPKADREKVTQIMFETFGVQALYVAVQAVLTLYDSGRATGTVVDLGEGVTRVVPVCDGFAMPHAVAQLHVAGQHFTDYLALLLKERDGIEFSGRAERAILREIKETLGFVALDEASCQSASDEVYEQPDGVLVNVSSERCRCFEVLWRPGLLGSEELGLHQLTLQSIMLCDRDLRPALGAVALGGGAARLRGLDQRLAREVAALGPEWPVEVAVKSAPEYSAWRGGALLAGIFGRGKQWISREEYMESGPSIVHQKCV
ncbi:unnamed protein product [Effrenium voratum]|nr:unnamed protein product [Effrenium voratum]